jgi:arginase
MVVDYGDSPVWRWRPDRESRFAQNVSAVVAQVTETAARVRAALAAGELPLVLGGDCTLELGTVSAHVTSDEPISLLYFDLHPDLNVPEPGGPGALDWMGVAHLLGEEKAVEDIAHIGPHFPLLAPEDILFFAYGPENRTVWEKELWQRRGLRGVAVEEVAADAERVAARALAELEARSQRVLVHFDVDTIDFTDAPLSENTGRNEGLSFDVAMRALRALLSSERLSAVTITELNPDHDPNGATVARFVDGLVDALRCAPVLRY